jgi:UDP-N-acetylmuramyl pentapeptide phosphotransferase/UDP-N-acetylglucosamine-1-phosphate transferase
MSVLAALVAGAVATMLLLRTTVAVLAHPTLDRENYRGHHLPTAVGVLLAAAVIAVDGARALLGVAGVGDADTAPARLGILGAVVMFAFLGLVDDLLGDAHDRGLRGHVIAALHGRVTTGFIKLGGGVAVAVVLAGTFDGDRPGRVILDGALIALAANMGNLLDRAPGRTIKWGLVAYVPIALAAGTAAAGIALAVVAGAAAVLLVGDLRERFMLGDTGANALGAALGLGVVLTAPLQGRAVVAAVLLGCNLASEVVSFSQVIDRVAPLRALDRWGRHRPPPTGD